jgi:hypothetical protein
MRLIGIPTYEVCAAGLGCVAGIRHVWHGLSVSCQAIALFETVVEFGPDGCKEALLGCGLLAAPLGSRIFGLGSSAAP